MHHKPNPFCQETWSTHKELEELEDPLVCENVKCVPRDGVDDGQPVDFVFDEGVHRVKQAANNNNRVDTMITKQLQKKVKKFNTHTTLHMENTHANVF